MIKTRTWIAIIAVILTVSAALCIFQSVHSNSGNTAYIMVDGEIIRTIDLSLVSEGYEFTISDELGENTIRVESGRICVIAADCPDKVCVDHGWLLDSSSFIACLPHHLYIKIGGAASNDDAVDAVSQ